ncbi:hypothetical protein B0J18DRAFT_151322 [Chaetomium sp. MPI-SDFR-AT-0129]|nr:hypothetical protein B0J18DRAFT_151322 [Chaetomium sp. MPI-SDFR-AT-0129]
MDLTARISLAGPGGTDPEDFFSAALGVIFPDDIANCHGDSNHPNLVYKSSHLPNAIRLVLPELAGQEAQALFSHYLWNASLLLAELIEAGSLGTQIQWNSQIAPPVAEFDISGLSTIELGAGTGLPSIMSGLLGARRVVVTDYPAPPVINTLKLNANASLKAESAPSGRFAVEEVVVEGHTWGELDTTFAVQNKHKFDRVFAADCLWIVGQHEQLRQSIAWFLAEGESARAWLIAGFHTPRGEANLFFRSEMLAEVGLEVEHLWERECSGEDREWVWDRGVGNTAVQKRWSAVGVLRRIRGHPV